MRFSTLQTSILPHQPFLLFQKTRVRQLSVSKLKKRPVKVFKQRLACEIVQHSFSVRKSTQSVLSKATVLLKNTRGLFLLQLTDVRIESRLEFRKKQNKTKTEFLLNIHQSKGFRESKLLLCIRRNSLRPSVLSCTCTPSGLTL